MARLAVAEDLGAVSPAVVWASGIAAEAGLGEALRHDLEVCLEEALANLIQHGRAPPGEKAIVIEVTTAPGRVELCIGDGCAPFDPAHAPTQPPPSLEGAHIGGAGLKLLRALAPGLSYASEAGRNHLRVSFTEPPPDDGFPSDLAARIGRIPAFASLTGAALADLIRAARPHRAAPGQKLLSQGEASDFAVLLLEGEVAIVNESAHGVTEVARVAAPALIGEIGALAGLARTASALTVSEASMLVIDRAALTAASRHSPDLLLRVVGQLGGQLQNLDAALGFYANGLAALERGALDPALIAALSQPSPELRNFSAAFARLAQRITTERRMRTELASAALIQRQMLPQGIEQLAAASGCDVYGEIKPARHVGGDLFDVQRIGPNQLALVVGDVCGKGVPASLFMSVTVTVLRLVGREAGTLEDKMRRVNDLLCAENESAMFCTLFYGVLDLSTRRLSYVNCGHNPPLALSAAGVHALAAGGPPLGVVPGKVWPVRTRDFAPGDALFLFTDGVSEAVDPSGAEYGESRLAAVLESFRGADAKTLVEAVTADVDAFAAGGEPFDDVTCLACIVPGAEKR